MEEKLTICPPPVPKFIYENDWLFLYVFDEFDQLPRGWEHKRLEPFSNVKFYGFSTSDHTEITKALIPFMAEYLVDNELWIKGDSRKMVIYYVLVPEKLQELHMRVDDKSWDNREDKFCFNSEELNYYAKSIMNRVPVEILVTQYDVDKYLKEVDNHLK